jgi:hypothetical protein
MHARFGLAPLHGALLLVFAGSIAERREAPVEPVWDGGNMLGSHRLTKWVALAALVLAPAWGSAALLTIGPDSSFVPRKLTQLPTSAPVAGTALATLGDGSVGFNGGLAHDGSGLFAIGNDSSGASTLYSMTTAGGSLTAVGPGLLGLGFYGGLAYRSGGGLYAIASDSLAASTLYQVTGGSATAVGSGLGDGFYGGLTWNADDSQLYAIAGDSLGVQWSLVAIDADTGAATLLFALGDGSIGFNGGLAYDAAADRFFVIGSDSLANSSLYSFTLGWPRQRDADRVELRAGLPQCLAGAAARRRPPRARAADALAAVQPAVRGAGVAQEPATLTPPIAARAAAIPFVVRRPPVEEMTMSHTCRSTLARIAAAATLGLLATAASGQYSTPIRDVENPARTRFMDSGSVVLTPGMAGATGDI